MPKKILTTVLSLLPAIAAVQPRQLKPVVPATGSVQISSLPLWPDDGILTDQLVRDHLFIEWRRPIRLRSPVCSKRK
jgi:hypothetical protein